MATFVTFALPETPCFAAAVPEGLTVGVGAQCVVDRNSSLELCRARLILDEAACCAAHSAQSTARVIRLATAEDLARAKISRELEEQALRQFDSEVANAPQGVYAVLARFNLDRSRLVVVYHADHRFDARRAAGSLGRRFQAAVDARQVGIRDEAGVLGGLGSCGRPTCCATWLHTFKPVNVRMAKDQGLSLNPNTINGSCGRLKCCLRYELTDPQATGEDEEGE